MESVVESQLTNVLEERGILSVNKFGFRNKLGITDALFLLEYEWVSKIDRSGVSRVLVTSCLVQNWYITSNTRHGNYHKDNHLAAVVGTDVPPCFLFEFDFNRSDFMAPPYLVVC